MRRRSRSRSATRFTVAAAALVVLGAVAWYFFGRGAAAPAAQPLSAAVAQALPEPAATVELDGTPSESAAARPSALAYRDPFDPLVTTDPAAAATTANATGAQVATTGGPATPERRDRSGTKDRSRGAGSVRGDISGHRVRLVQTYRRNGNDKIEVVIDGTRWWIGEGRWFAGGFRLVSVVDGCAAMRFRQHRFQLCRGQPGRD